MRNRKKLTPIHVRLREARKAAGATQDEMAEVFGVIRTSYTKAELGLRKLRAEEVRQAAIYLEVPIDQLIPLRG